MNQNEGGKIELKKSELLNETTNNSNPITSNETTPSSEVLKEIKNEECNQSVSIQGSIVDETSMANVSGNLPNRKSSVPISSECATIDDATSDEKENTEGATSCSFCCERSPSKHVDLTTEATTDATSSQKCAASTENDITSPSATEKAIITAPKATTSTASDYIASPSTSSAADIRHLHHVASAPVLSCSPMRANQQQQKKIKIYHDAKQTALWDTKSSTSSGGAILKSVISSTYGSPKMLRKSSESSSCGTLPRRVSFPKSDNELVTGYLEPANPWEHVSSVNSVSEIADLYVKSCHKHNTKPLENILEQLKAVELNKLTRQPMLSLKKVQLLPGDCEALEEILKRVQYKYIDLSSCELEECAVSTIFEIIEYYEAANELNISTNPKGMTQRGWNSCAYMIGRSQELQILNADGNPLSKSNAEQLGHALNTSNIHTIKLEHCGLKGALGGFCSKLRQNKVLKELWLAHNDLDCQDAENIADLLKVNHYLEFVDISNNNIGDKGLKHIVSALIAQSKELERRSMFQRAAAIDDDIFSPVETSVDEESCQFKDTENHDTNRPLTNAINEGKLVETFNDKDNNDIGDDSSKKDNAEQVLIPDLDTLIVEKEANSLDVTSLIIEETENEDDTEDTVKSNNTIKIKQQSSAGSSGGGVQSMLDKLLSMNSDSSSEEGASNLSTDTIAACGSDDTSFVSDDIFDVTSTTIPAATTTTNTNSKANPSTATSEITETVMITFGSPLNIRNENIQKNEAMIVFNEKVDSCDTCTLEASNQCECIGDERKESTSSLIAHCCHNTYNNNTNNNNNNNNVNIVQNEPNDFRELSHNKETHKEPVQGTISGDSHANVDVFEVTAVESYCVVPCSSSNKSNALMVQNNSNNVDVNKNTRLTEDCDDTHSTDSAFESASEGDISRTLPEEFTRLSASLESTRLDDVAKEMAIETATIATESTEYLAESGETSVSTPSVNTLSLVKIGTQKSDEVKTKGAEVRFCETVLLESNETSQPAGALVPEQEKLLPKVTIETAPVTSVKRCEDNNNPIPTPPPPSTSPGGASLSMRRTDSSCNFTMQSTRHHSQRSDSLCSDNSLDSSVSCDLNLSTSVPLNEKLTKNDTLTRQQRQYDSTTESINRAPGGLKALAVWNNNLTKEAGLYISDLLADTTSLELLNIGKNCLSNEFVFQIKDSLKKNTTLTTLGLQSAHLSAKGIEALSSILAFGGNSTLQRIDIRDNKLEVESLTTLADALKSNTTVSQIDIDDEPKRLSVGSDAHLDYVKVVENLRSMCSRNEKTQAQLQAEKTANSGSSNKRRGGYYVGSRKISLTCHSRPLIEYSAAPAVTMPSATNKLEVKRKTGVRLRSPQPSPPTISPSSSPNRSRFQVYLVNEVSPLTSPAGNNAPTPILSCSADFKQESMISTSSLTTSTSLPSMVTATSSTQTIRRHAGSPRSRFHVSKIYEDPKVPLAKRSLPPITPPIHLPPTPMIKSAPKISKLHSNENSEKEKELCTDPQTTPANTSIDTIDANESNEKLPSTRCPIVEFNENDITLTHSSAGEVLSSSNISVGCNESETKKEAPTEENTTCLTANTTAQQVVSKVSWIGNPAAVEKLLTLFQNPSTYFQRSSSPEPKNMSTNNACAASLSDRRNSTSQVIQKGKQMQYSPVSTVKQSPPKWSKIGSDMLNVSVADADKTLTNEQPKSFLGAASKQLRDLGKQVFRQNVATSENTPTGTSTDNLLNMTATVPSENSDDAVRVYLRPTDRKTESTESNSSERTNDDNRLFHQTHNPKSSEHQTDLPVTTTIVHKIEGEKFVDELGTKRNAD